jgi:N-acetylmuramoyl-L-alanine amidase CwlA
VPTPQNPITPNTPAAPSQASTFGIIPRSAWAKAGPDMKRVDPMDGVGLITFHHSGDPKAFVINDYAGTAAHLEGVRAYHRSRNFQDIGYHFAIDRMGRVWQLRPLAYEGQHVRYNNEHNVGVVVLGNFDIQAPTAAQKESVKSFGQLLRKQYNLAATKIKTHQEIVSTECPGDGLQPYMIQVRKQGLI